MPSKYKLTVLDKSGKEAQIDWNLDRDPTDAEIDAILTAKTGKPTSDSSFFQGAGETLREFVRGGKRIVRPTIINLKQGDAKRLPGSIYNAFADVGEMVFGPVQSTRDVLASKTNPLISRLVLGEDLTKKIQEKSPEIPWTAIPESFGIPASQMIEDVGRGEYRTAAGRGVAGLAMLEAGRRMGKPKPKITPKPELGIDLKYDSPIGPKPATPFEGLSRNPENSPRINWNDPQQQGLGLDFDVLEKQQTLPIPDITSPAQSAFDALVPDRYKVEITGPRQPDLFGLSKGLDVSKALAPSELEPRFISTERPTWTSFAEQKKLPFDMDLLAAAEKSGIPEVARAAEQVVKERASRGIFSRRGGWRNPNKTQGSLSRTKDDFIKSNMQVLVDDSPAGMGIKGLIDRFRTEVGRTSGSISAAIKDVVEPLNKPQYAEWQALLDQGGNSPDPMIQNALDVARKIDADFTARATASGVHLKLPDGKIVPFTGKDNYWPRLYDPALFKDKPALIERLIKQGMSPEAAAKAVNESRRFGERLIDPQHARVLDLPEHRKDLGALLKHYDDMAHRVVGAETFGVKDIADINTPISQLVAGTKDPSRITKILTQYLDRDGGVQAHEVEVAKKVTKAATLYYLSKFALSNTNQLAFVPIVTNFKSTLKALGQFVSSPKRTWREAEGMGALQTVMQEGLRDAGGESLASKIYGIKASEGSNRTIAAIAGKHYSNDVFAAAKRGNVKAQKTIQDLTLENWDVLKNQDALTDKQHAYAATRVAEKTQGRAQSIDLPYNWDTHPYIGLLLLYKKFAFVQNRAMKEALKIDPNKPLTPSNLNTRNLALLAILFQAAGEVTGDVKAGIKGSVMGDLEDEIARRGENWNTGSDVLNRAIQNYADSMFLGLLGSVAESARGGKWGMANMLLGPIYSAPVEIGGNIQSDIVNPPASASDSKTLQGLASHIPFIGSGVREALRK